MQGLNLLAAAREGNIKGSSFNPRALPGKRYMSIVAIHLLVGLLAGMVFGVQTLLVLAVVVLVEAAGMVVVNGPSVDIFWWVGAEVALQLGYLAGIYLRSMIERMGRVTKMASNRRSY